MINFLDSLNPIFYSSQHGFCPGRSTDTAGVTFVDFSTHSMDCGNVNDIIFLDITKAFDSLPQSAFIKKLCCVGISGVLLRWLIDNLGDRNLREYIMFCQTLHLLLAVLFKVIVCFFVDFCFFMIYVDDINSCAKKQLFCQTRWRY